jgi:hypothetical protein
MQSVTRPAAGAAGRLSDRDATRRGGGEWSARARADSQTRRRRRPGPFHDRVSHEGVYRTYVW